MLSPIEEIQRVVDRTLDGKAEIHALDAGCGSLAQINLGPNTRAVGIDIDQGQLDRNTHLDERILGDLETHEFPQDKFDIIVCWQVLEHLATPENVLRSFVRSIKPGGLVIIDVPNVYSIKGLITKFTPHWFHVWVYRHVFKQPTAGLPSYPPFRTFLRTSVGPSALRRYFEENDFEEEYFYVWPTMKLSLKQTSWIAHAAYSIVHGVTYVCTLGMYNGDPSEILFVARKKG